MTFKDPRIAFIISSIFHAISSLCNLKELEEKLQKQADYEEVKKELR